MASSVWDRLRAVYEMEDILRILLGVEDEDADKIHVICWRDPLDEEDRLHIVYEYNHTRCLLKAPMYRVLAAYKELEWRKRDMFF